MGRSRLRLGVIFLHDDPREVFPSEYALWTRRGRFCHGELVQITNGSGAHYKMQAIRRTREHPEGEPWPGERKYLDGPQKGQPVEGCGAGCPELESGNCGPSGDLYFILEKFPSLGAICRLHTGGKTSVPNLSNAVAQLHSWNGGRLKGVKATLKVTPEMRWHPGRIGGWETSIVPILSLEIGGTYTRRPHHRYDGACKALSESADCAVLVNSGDSVLCGKAKRNAPQRLPTSSIRRTETL